MSSKYAVEVAVESDSLLDTTVIAIASVINVVSYDLIWRLVCILPSKFFESLALAYMMADLPSIGFSPR